MQLNALLKSTKRQLNELEALAVDLFRGDKSGAIYSHMYSKQGAQAWNHFVQHSTAYYPHHEEVELANAFCGDIKKQVGLVHHIADLGAGMAYAVQNKTYPFLKAFNPKGYFPIDVSQDSLNAAIDTVEQDFKHMLCHPVHMNYLKDDSPIEFFDNTLSLMFGISIGNIPEYIEAGTPDNGLSHVLYAIRKAMSHKGYLAITIDTNKDEQSILHSYRDIGNEQMCLSVMHRIQRQENTQGFDGQAFRYKPVWHEKKSLLAHTLVSLKKQHFMIGDELCYIEAGQEFVVSNSYKYSDAYFTDIAQSCGFETVRKYALPSGKLSLNLFRIH